MDGESDGCRASDAGDLLCAVSREHAGGSYDPQSLPTLQQYGAFAAAFDHFNTELFDSKLPAVLLTFCTKSKARGFFASDRWRAAGVTHCGTVHEISLNPEHLSREPCAVASTIVHEMVHLWQHAFGKPGRRGYHNTEWAERMETIGLMPSSTGCPGGKRTGQSVTHYIVEGGAFDAAWLRLSSEALLPLLSGSPEQAQMSKRTKQLASKTKFACSRCASCAWGKPDLRLVCGVCNQPMAASMRGPNASKSGELNDPTTDRELRP